MSSTQELFSQHGWGRWDPNRSAALMKEFQKLPRVDEGVQIDVVFCWGVGAWVTFGLYRAHTFKPGSGGRVECARMFCKPRSETYVKGRDGFWGWTQANPYGYVEGNMTIDEEGLSESTLIKTLPGLGIRIGMSLPLMGETDHRKVEPKLKARRDICAKAGIVLAHRDRLLSDCTVDISFREVQDLAQEWGRGVFQ